MTMLPNPPEFVENELKNVLQHGANDFWIINCSKCKTPCILSQFSLQDSGKQEAWNHRSLDRAGICKEVLRIRTKEKRSSAP